LPTRWSAKENVRWKADLPGRGLSNPVIADGRVFVTASSGYLESRLHVLCFDLATGKKLRERQFWSTGSTNCHTKTCMAAPTPVTDGKAVYALFATGDLAALDSSGNLLWYRALARDYPTITNQVGMAASPILWKDTLILPMENMGDSFVAGLDRSTGQNCWKIARDKDIIWTTPLLRVLGDRAEVVFVSNKDALAVDAATGKKRWSYRGEGLSSIPSPIATEGAIVLPGGVALQPGGENKEPVVVWKSGKLRTGMNSFLHYQDRVYAVNGAGVLNCADAKTGAVLWNLRLKGPYTASPVAGDGKIYVVNEAGSTTVIELGEKEGQAVATNELGETILATPAIADGAIFLRSDQHLFCVGGREK
jgi:outer membrane protein assembly factor BamB